MVDGAALRAGSLATQAVSGDVEMLARLSATIPWLDRSDSALDQGECAKLWPSDAGDLCGNFAGIRHAQLCSVVINGNGRHAASD